MRWFAIPLIIVVTANACLAAEATPLSSDFSAVAANLAPKIAKEVIARQKSESYRLAVFPVGNRDGRVTLETAEGSAILQGELIYQLITEARGKFLVLDKAGLRREFKASGIDPTGFSAGKPKETAALLTKLGIDVAVLGSFDSLGFVKSLEENQRKVNTSLTVVFKDGSFTQVSAGSLVHSVPPPYNESTCGRFNVQLLLRQKDKLVPIPLVTAKNPASKYHGVFFAVVPKSIELGSKDAEFVIRIMNDGKTPFLHPETRSFLLGKKASEKEKQRLIAAAVTLDGVNSIYQDIGDGKTIGPVIVHPRCTSRWVLCGPGKSVISDRNHPEGYALEDARGKGGAEMDLKGFQLDDRDAQAFTFARLGEGLAEKMGITNEVGMIAVHFFPQKFDSDKDEMPPPIPASGVGPPEAPGTPVPDVTITPGRKLKSRAFTIRPRLYDEPAEVWRIFYRTEGNLPGDLEDDSKRILITNEPFKIARILQP